MSDVSFLASLLRELDEVGNDAEHGSVSVTHESEWCLTAFRGGSVVLEHLEDGGERHMRGAGEQKIIQLWSLLAVGDLATILEEPWKPGYQ